MLAKMGGVRRPGVEPIRFEIPQESSTSRAWDRGPTRPCLRPGHVDVWRVSIDEPLSSVPDGDASVLATDELARAGRFHFEKDRCRFTRCRSALRVLLGRYLDLSPSRVRFICGPNGKPEIAADQNPQQLRFNVSHSANLALIGVGLRHRLGVDIEEIRAEVDIAELADLFFSTRERAGLRSMQDQLRLQAFFACWTRKEAFLKAVGFGLSFPLSHFSVSTHLHDSPELQEIQGDPQAAKQWSLADIPVEEGYRATVAIESAFPTLSTFLYHTS
jgi:4'-phosphopantetheinyl transferase